jgi:hypothetical protein
MSNKELEIKIKEIINQNNYFDMIIQANNFESEYKKTDFYKTTKKPLMEVIKESKIFYTLELTNIKDKLQLLINGLNLDRIVEIVNEFADVLANENMEVSNAMQTMRDLLGEIQE